VEISEIVSNLCYYDLRNPNGFIELYDPEEDKEIGEYSAKDCNCDNCFYNRTKLAEYILKIIETNTK
jgi:hypothetical protein